MARGAEHFHSLSPGMRQCYQDKNNDDKKKRMEQMIHKRDELRVAIKLCEERRQRDHK